MSITSASTVEEIVPAAITILGQDAASTELQVDSFAPQLDADQNRELDRPNNPSWWPANHRRIPNYRPPSYHPQWRELTSTTGEATMINLMFIGCHLLQVVFYPPNFQETSLISPKDSGGLTEIFRARLQLLYVSSCWRVVRAMENQ